MAIHLMIMNTRNYGNIGREGMKRVISGHPAKFAGLIFWVHPPWFWKPVVVYVSFVLLFNLEYFVAVIELRRLCPVHKEDAQIWRKNKRIAKTIVNGYKLTMQKLHYTYGRVKNKGVHYEIGHFLHFLRSSRKYIKFQQKYTNVFNPKKDLNIMISKLLFIL